MSAGIATLKSPSFISSNKSEIVFFNLFLEVSQIEIKMKKKYCDLEICGKIYKRNAIFRLIFLLRPGFSLTPKNMVRRDGAVLFGSKDLLFPL